MCGRYAITLPPEAVTFPSCETPNFPPRYNIAPTQPIPVVTADPYSAGAIRHFMLMRWGFLRLRQGPERLSAHHQRPR